MKSCKLLLSFIPLFLGGGVLAQTSTTTTRTDVIRLGTSGSVSNTIIYNNPAQKPVSEGVAIIHSASDSAIGGINNRHSLPTSPFVKGEYRINSSSPAFNAGTHEGRRVGDTLDLDYKPRVTMQELIDMGAFEFDIQKTEVLTQPGDAFPGTGTDTTPPGPRLCVGTPVTLTTGAVGENITYQWLKDGELLYGQTKASLTLAGNVEDDGLYRVIAYGDWDTDTSDPVRVTIDPMPSLVVMDDTVVMENGSVLLYTISQTGTVEWFNDYTTPVTDPHVTGIMGTQLFVAVAKSGVCDSVAYGFVHVTVEGSPCEIRVATADTAICIGDSYRLRADMANTKVAITEWYNVMNPNEIYKPNWLITPSATLYLRARGQIDDNGTLLTCESFDTLILRVTTVTLSLTNEMNFCEGDISTVVLTSTPREGVEWYDEFYNYIGAEYVTVRPIARKLSIYYAKKEQNHCTRWEMVKVYVNPPDIIPMASEVTICEGDLVHLSTNVEPERVQWYEGNAPLPMGVTTVEPGAPDFAVRRVVYRAVYDDGYCPTSEATVVVNLDAKPSFKAMPHEAVCEGDVIYLTGVPNASYWTIDDAASSRVSALHLATSKASTSSNTSTTTYIGVYREGMCETTDDVTVTVETMPNLVVESDTVIDWSGNGLILWSDPTATYWTANDGSGEVELSGASYYVNPRISTEYTAYYESESGVCLTSKSRKVEVIDTAEVVFVVESTVTHPNNENCDGGGVVLSVTAGGEGPWDFQWYRVEYVMAGNGGYMDTTLLPGEVNASLSDAHAGSYLVHIINADGKEGWVPVDLSCEYQRKVMPTLFISPNGNGKNDHLIIGHIENYYPARVIILNSFGEEVWRTEDYRNGVEGKSWMGTTQKGAALPDGVYYYIVEPKGVKAMAGWLMMKKD